MQKLIELIFSVMRTIEHRVEALESNVTATPSAICDILGRIEALEAQGGAIRQPNCLICANNPNCGECTGINDGGNPPLNWKENEPKPQPIGKDRNGVDVFVGDTVRTTTMLLDIVITPNCAFELISCVLWKRGDTAG